MELVTGGTEPDAGFFFFFRLPTFRCSVASPFPQSLEGDWIDNLKTFHPFETRGSAEKPNMKSNTYTPSEIAIRAMASCCDCEKI